jgi:hypothetical protein
MYDKRLLMKLLGKVQTIELEDLYSIPRTMKKCGNGGQNQQHTCSKLSTNIYLRFPRPIVQHVNHHMIPY